MSNLKVSHPILTVVKYFVFIFSLVFLPEKGHIFNVLLWNKWSTSPFLIVQAWIRSTVRKTRIFQLGYPLCKTLILTVWLWWHKCVIYYVQYIFSDSVCRKGVRDSSCLLHMFVIHWLRYDVYHIRYMLYGISYTIYIVKPLRSIIYGNG